MLEIAARSAVVRSTEGSIFVRETDREQVPRGKVEKDSEERVKENAKPSWTNGETVSASRHPLRPRPVPWRSPERLGACRSEVRRPNLEVELVWAREAAPGPSGPGRRRAPTRRAPMEGGGRSIASRLSPLTTRLETRTEESNACASSETRKCQSKAERKQSCEAPAARQVARAALGASASNRSADERTRKMVNYA